MLKKLLIPIFSIFILMGQMPPNIIIDENEKDIRIKPNIAGMKEFVAGNNPAGKAIYAECVESAQLYELSKIEL